MGLFIFVLFSLTYIIPLAMKRNVFTFIITLLVLLLPTPHYASFFKEISIKNGLSNRKVYAVTKDNRGYLWFVTHSGIDRYNGDSFNFYKLPPFNTQGNEFPKGIITNSSGQIYTFSDKNIYYFDDNSNSFSILKEFKSATTESVTTLFSPEKNCLLIGTTENLYVFSNHATQQTIRLPRTYAVYSITPEKNNLWIGTSHGVFKLIRSSSKTYSVQQDTELKLLNNSRIQSLFFDPLSKNLWIGTFSEGLKIYNTESRTWDSSPALTLSFPIRKITPISNNKIWIGTDGAGIRELNRFTFDELREFSQSSKGINHLKANGIYDLYNDSTFVWICTYTSGIFIYNKNQIISKIYTSRENEPNSLNNNQVNAILEDSKGNLWFGTEKGISIHNEKNKTWKHFQENNKTNHSVILCIYEDSQRRIWTGGYACDLTCFDPKSGKIETLRLSERNKNYVYSIFEDSEQNMWFGGIINNLTRYNPKNKTLKQYKVKGINKIISYNQNTLLLGTNHGVIFLDVHTGKSLPVNLKEMKGDVPLHAYPFVNSLCFDPIDKNCVWIGTEGDGIYKYNIAQKQIKHYSTKNGLSSDNVCGIQSDRQGRLWISTENGLNCFSPQKSQFEVFYEIDGLPDNSFNFLAYTIRKNGNLMWGTPEGAIEIDPDKFDEKEEFQFNLKFESFSLFYSTVTPQTKDSPLKYPIDRTKDIHLSYKQHSFSFDFINLSFFNNSQILYTWKLDGFDEQWSTPSHEHKATYTNITPGKYTFLVKAYRADNTNISTTRQIRIVITPPFWATSWAILFYIIIAGIVGYFIINAYKNRLDAKDSDQKIRFFVNIAHDIRTPLTLIKAPLNEIENEPLSENGLAALKLAKKNTEKLLNMVTQLLDFQKIEQEAMSLHIEETPINDFIDGCVSNFQLLAKEKYIKLSLQQPQEKHRGWIDRRKLTIIMDNLLSNAVKYTGQYGNVAVVVTYKADSLCIAITDDGIGISAKEQNKLFNRFYRAENAANSKETGSGIGLLLTKRMVLLHKGEISFSSTEGIGTSFHIQLPINKSAYQVSEIIEKETEVPDNYSSSSQEESENEKNKLKLLMVEDNEELRSYLSKYLQKHYAVTEAENGYKALECIKKDSPDFIISDILMPEMTGIELCQKLKSNIETCHIPVILLTSLAERENIIEGFNAGADDYITKPFDLPVLESKIQAIIKNRVLYRKKYIDKSAFTDESNIVSEMDRKFMCQIVEYIEEQMVNEDFSIDTLAVEMAMSRSVFYKKIKSLTTQNPQEFIRDLKMKKAVRLIREQKYSIGEIAYLTGYPNAKYFSTAFKKFYGCTPTSYLEKESESAD